MNRDLLHITHVLECIARIGRYTADGRERFLAEDMVQDAVIRNLQILAESTQKISEKQKAAPRSGMANNRGIPQRAGAQLSRAGLRGGLVDCRE